MRIQEALNKIIEETGVVVSRPKVYHYDRKGMLGYVKRLGNRYREFNNTDYNKLKLAMMLSELGVSLDDIGRVLTDTKEGWELCEKVLRVKEKALKSAMDMLS